MGLSNVWKASYHDLGVLILRLSFGALMLVAHGIPKLTNFPSASFPDPLGIGATLSMSLALFAEVFCSLLLMLGLWTRLALISLITNMLVIILMVHKLDPFKLKELAVIFLIAYVGLFFTGAGKFSVDAKIG